VDIESPRIQQFAPGDLEDLYRICLQTADNGQDGTAAFRDPRLPGDVYAAPYAMLEPSLALVAEDSAGVGGYVVAALDSQDFDRRLERAWWPALRARYPEPPPEVALELSVQERFALHFIHHPLATDPELAGRYPSHLHIDLLPRLQGRGYGRQLIAALISSLRSQGSTGLHLHVGRANQRAAGFYRHTGFAELPGSNIGRVFAMTLQPREARHIGLP
jgi:ribosomal protein S18 acetylase RimI-like enzyme